MTLYFPSASLNYKNNCSHLFSVANLEAWLTNLLPITSLSIIVKKKAFFTHSLLFIEVSLPLCYMSSVFSQHLPLKISISPHLLTTAYNYSFFDQPLSEFYLINSKQ